MADMTIGGINSSLSQADIEGFGSHSRIDGPTSPDMSGQGSATGGPGSFMEALKQGLDKVNSVQTEADHAIKEAVAGRNKNIHETMLLIEKADMTYKLAMQVRNKIIDAYREVMKMQV